MSTSLTPDSDIERTYRSRVARMCGKMPFPDLLLTTGADQANISFSNTFVLPQLERETQGFAITEMMLSMQVGNEAVHPRNLRGQGGQSGEKMSLRDSLRLSSCMMVLGDAGAGKTTLLKYLTTLCATNQTRAEPVLMTASGDALLPVFLSLSDYAMAAASRSLDYSIIHHIYTLANEQLHCTPPYGFFEHALEAGHCLICLDGLDEVWDVRQRKEVCDAISNLVARFPRCRTLVTSRPMGYSQAPLDYTTFDHYVLLPFQAAQIRSFVEHWYRQQARSGIDRHRKVSYLLAAIEREPQIRTMAHNPMLLTLIAMLYDLIPSLPLERVSLYETGVTIILDRWLQAMELRAEEKGHVFYRLLRRWVERLAYEMHVRAVQPAQRQAVTTKELEVLLTGFLMEHLQGDTLEQSAFVQDEIRHFIQMVRHQPGLLREEHDGIFTFAHLTFQEYLVACDIEQRCQNDGEAIWNEIQDQLLAPHWHEVLLFLMGRLSGGEDLPTDLAKRILQAGLEDPFEPVLHRHLYLVAAILSTPSNVAAALRREVVDAILHIVRHTSWNERQDGFRILSRLEGDGYAAMGLLELMSNPEVEMAVRLEAATTLGRLEHTNEATDVLLELARDSRAESWCTRSAAVVVGTLGRTEEAAEILLALARNERRAIRERCAAAVALGNMGYSDEAADILMGLARDGQGNAAERRQAAETLGRLGRRETAVEILLELASKPEYSAWQRRYAAEALGMFGLQDDAARILLALARDQSMESRVRRFAIEGLGNLGYRDLTVTDGLLALARDRARSSWERTAAAVALGKLGRSAEAVRVLKEFAHDTRWGASVRRVAAVTLGLLGHPDEAGEVLLALACDSLGDPWERCTAAMGMATLGRTDRVVQESLLMLAHNPKAQDDERGTAAVALGKFGRVEEATEVLLRLARDVQVQEWVRRTAYDSLKRLVG